MYCKNCGKEIPDDSKFCQHCGCSQSNNDNNISERDNDKSISDNSLPNHGNIIKFLSKNKKFIGIYAIWLIINFILYCYGEDYVGNFVDLPSKDYFYPFTNVYHPFVSTHIFDARFYDITELLFYCILLPLVLLYGIQFIKRRNNNK